MKTAEDFFTQKNGGKTAEELLSEGVLISPILAVMLMEQYHESRMKEELIEFSIRWNRTKYFSHITIEEIDDYLATRKNK